MITRAFVIGLALFTLTACETAKGVGRDVQKAGAAVSNTAKKVQNSI